MSAAARVHRLALNVERAESVRAVKRVQETYAQYSQFGLWTEMAALFADNAQLSYGKDAEQGRQAIQNYFLTTFGEGTHGLKPGGLHTQMVLRPLINVSADGQTAKGRWWEFSMTGQHGVKAEWAAGIFENEYVRERGVWKISRMRYNPMFAGPYATGWRNVDEDQKIVPYHFTPDETGIPVPDLPASAMPPVDPKMNPATALAALEQRISVMNDEDKVRNLQNAYGYYMDRKMWDDVTDLFTADGALSIANVGVYDGPKSIRRALERSGPAGLKHGQLNELMQLDMTVAIEPGGMEARARGLEFGMLGEADKGTAFYTLAVFENRYVKQNDIWRIREMRIFPVMKTDKAQGWAKSQVVDPAPAKEHAPDRPVPAADVMTPGRDSGVLRAEPGHGQGGEPAGGRQDGGARAAAAGAGGPPRAAAAGDLEARITEAERRLAVSKAWDGAENLSSAYGDYLDDLDFGQLAKLFAVNGNKEIPFSGFYVGRASIAKRDATSPPPGSRPRTSLPLHWRTQPVILVAPDGRSASIRSRLFQPGSSRTRSWASGAACTTIRSCWKTACGGCGASRSTSTTSRRRVRRRLVRCEAPQRGSAARMEPRRPDRGRAAQHRGAAAAAQANSYPPDIPLTQAGRARAGLPRRHRRDDHVAGHPADVVPLQEPGQRTRPRTLLAGLRAVRAVPETSMKNHGYLLPPS